jgi:hypothetical protein
LPAAPVGATPAAEEPRAAGGGCSGGGAGQRPSARGRDPRRGAALRLADAGGRAASLQAGGGGVTGRLADGTQVLVGSPEFAAAHGVDVASLRDAAEDFARRGWTLAVVATAGRARLPLGLADRIRPTATRAVRVLHKLGVRVVMTTGDHARAAAAIAALAGIDEVHAGESPAAKRPASARCAPAARSWAWWATAATTRPRSPPRTSASRWAAPPELARGSAQLVLVRGDPRAAPWPSSWRAPRCASCARTCSSPSPTTSWPSRWRLSASWTRPRGGGHGGQQPGRGGQRPAPARRFRSRLETDFGLES